jgi:hypothetical protein
MAVATTTETVEPPPVSWPGQAALPVSDAAISVHALERAHARDFFIVQAGPFQFKQR